MASIHDSEYCSALRARVDKLESTSQRQWGEMSVDQMLWHLNSAMSLGLGKLRAAPMKSAIPLALMRPIVLYLPWPKGRAQTVPELLATGTYDFNAERVRFHALIEEFALKPLHFNWLDHPMFGHLSGPAWSRLAAKHTDHHLRQFGV
jgi:Protein of unknown function (DUF1569)